VMVACVWAHRRIVFCIDRLELSLLNVFFRWKAVILKIMSIGVLIDSSKSLQLCLVDLP